MVRSRHTTMEKAELLKVFNQHLENYASFRSFIDKAVAQQGKFSQATIDRVVEKNEARSLEEGDLIRPLVPELEEVALELRVEIDTITERTRSATVEMEELELRKIIGELSDEEFDQESSRFKDDLAAADQRISVLNADLSVFTDALDRWETLAVAAGHPTGRSEETPEPEADQAPSSEPDLSQAFDEAEHSVDAGSSLDESDDIRASTAGMREDLSGVFGAPEPAVQIPAGDEDEEISIEVPDAGSSELGDGEIEIGFDGGGESDIDLINDDSEEQLDFTGGGDEPASDDLGFDEPAAGPAEKSPAGGGAAGQRRALLIYQEGTAEESMHPLTNEEFTIGRGRDNDFQIKNDSKVSRYHCKIFRRGDNFYIEDNKSSNGSLVNGELITERRLFGGEEVIIGETFFRFRIME